MFVQHQVALHFYGLDYQLIVKIADKIINKYKCLGNFTIKNGELVVNIYKNQATDDQFIEAQNKLIDQTNSCFVGYGEDEDNGILEQVVGKQLIKKNLSITAAESLTAGKFQSLLGSVSGISNVFSGGFVTYSAEAKHKLLDIPNETIQKSGVVSKATAIWMAKQSKKIMGTDIGVSFTGVAGPDSLEGNPAGTVWIGVSFADHFDIAKKYRFSANILDTFDDKVMNQSLNFNNDNQNRNNIRLFSAKMGLKMIKDQLDKKNIF